VELENHLGTHYILDACNSNGELLNNKEYIMNSLKHAILKSNATLVEEIAVEFTPQGITAVCLLAESHLSIHTWPEKSYAAIDIFTCGDHCNPIDACNFLVNAFESKTPKIHVINRGYGFS
jgi:S-adenosylmethionine decarboxylase